MNRRSLRLLALVLLMALAAFAPPAPAEDGGPIVQTTVRGVLEKGGLELALTCDEFAALGFGRSDLVVVTVGGAVYEMPVVADVRYVSAKEKCIVMPKKSGGRHIRLTRRGGGLAKALGIATKAKTEEAPGYRWDFTEDYQGEITVGIAMKQAKALETDYALRNLKVNKKRKAFPDLTDAEFANFRNVATTGMGKNVLYRSSSPIGTSLKRNKQADAAAREAGIRTVLNLCDRAKKVAKRKGYKDSYYSTLDIYALEVSENIDSKAFRKALVKELRFMIEHEGPYLVHCILGKDRTGFACAVLECLMGATADEVKADYMLSYYNLYGIGPGDALYEPAYEKLLGAQLANAFKVEDIADPGVDLAACARRYLAAIGLEGGEIAALQGRLAVDY